MQLDENFKEPADVVDNYRRIPSETTPVANENNLGGQAIEPITLDTAANANISATTDRFDETSRAANALKRRYHALYMSQRGGVAAGLVAIADMGFNRLNHNHNYNHAISALACIVGFTSLALAYNAARLKTLLNGDLASPNVLHRIRIAFAVAAVMAITSGPTHNNSPIEDVQQKPAVSIPSSATNQAVNHLLNMQKAAATNNADIRAIYVSDHGQNYFFITGSENSIPTVAYGVARIPEVSSTSLLSGMPAEVKSDFTQLLQDTKDRGLNSDPAFKKLYQEWSANTFSFDPFNYSAPKSVPNFSSEIATTSNLLQWPADWRSRQQP